MKTVLDKSSFTNIAHEFHQFKSTCSKASKPKTFMQKLEQQYNIWLISHLEPIFEAGFIDDKSVTDLQNLFFLNQELTFNNCLSPTAIPQSNAMNLLCSIAPLVCGEKQPIQMLFKDISWESNNTDVWPHLDASIPLQQIIATHILSDDGTTLIPVAALLEENFLEDFYKDTLKLNKHYNYYHNDYPTLSDNEILRLIQHSHLTISMDESLKTYYQLLENNSSDLYSNLNTLCLALTIESSSGRGGEYKAGEGAFIAVAAFNEYYTQLTEDQINQIPYSVRKAIDELFDVGSVYRGDMRGQVDSCIAIRRSHLKNSMDGNQRILTSITLSDDTLNLRKAEALSIKSNNIENLRKKLTENEYNEGSDKLSLNPSLLNLLHIDFKLFKPQDISIFQQISDVDISALLLDNCHMHESVVSNIGSLENFIHLVNDLGIEQLDAVLAHILPRICQSYINRNVDIAALLNGIQDTRKIELFIYHYSIPGDFDINLLKASASEALGKAIDRKNTLLDVINQSIANPETLTEFILSIPESFIQQSLLKALGFAVINRRMNNRISVERACEYMDVLLIMGWNVNAVNVQGRTPLMQSLGDVQLTNYLLSKNASPLVQDIHNHSALHIAANDEQYHEVLVLEFEHVIRNRERLTKLSFNDSNYTDYSHYVTNFTNALDREPIQNQNKASYLSNLKFNEIIKELLLSKIDCDAKAQSNNAKIAKVNQEKSKALADLIDELIQARRNLCSDADAFDYQMQKQFNDRCIQALNHAMPELQKYRDTAGLIIKFLLCLLIIPAIIFAIRGELTLKTNSETQANRLMNGLNKMSFFKTPARVVQTGEQVNLLASPV